MKYQPHPFASIWPLLEGEDFDKFTTDIKANGLLQPITLYQGMILDGRNREAACSAAGVEPRYVQSTATSDDEALAIVVSLNEPRRHLSVAQRGFAAARLANIKHGSSQHGVEISKEISAPKVERDPSMPGNSGTVREAAHIMNVSPGTLARARAILNHAPELEKAVVKKSMSLAIAGERAFAIGSEKKAKRQPKKTKASAKVAKKTAIDIITEQRQPLWRRKLTPEQVDPEFTGTPMEWTDKYGHVQIETAEERARGRFCDWAIAIGHLAKVLDQQQLPNEVDLNWLRSPLLRDVERMDLAIPKLKAAIEKAEAMLAQARTALVKRKEGATK